MTPSEFQSAVQASDEQMARLQRYVDLLVKWQAKINLVGPDTLSDVWSRHMLDSAQLMPLIPRGAKVVDLGSGAGFPGLVLAIMRPDLDVHLVESDQRKCAFLREVNRETQAGVTVHNARIEALEPLKADVVTSRALASLDKLIGFASIHGLSTRKCLFPKGKRWAEELTQAEISWKMQATPHPSRTEPAGRILELLNIERV